MTVSHAPAASAPFRITPRFAWIAAIGGALALFAAAVIAQIEGTERGVNAIDSSQDFAVSGIKVDVSAKTAEAARLGGWREAQRRGWRMLWTQTHGGGAPGLSDSQLDGIVAGIVIENEQIGPTRYVATLGVLFDRVRAGTILGISGVSSRSAPLLIVPIEWSGGTATVFEGRTEWQKAWARFRSANSPIDYVRPSGTGSDPLLLNYGQITRPGRRWWRMVLDQFGAADVLMPQVRLERMWPGGPVIGHFSARYGPDARYLDSFVLRVESSAALPRMMDEGVKRMDAIFALALAEGRLRPDSSLIVEEPMLPEELELETTPTIATEEAAGGEIPVTSGTNTFTVQFDTPDVASVSATESAVRGISGVRAASTGSLALGGVSVMRVAFSGDEAALRAGLAARGFKVQDAGGAIRISR